MSKAETPSGTANRPPLALIAGPTASGKSDVAYDLAFALELSGRPAIIINADSAQVYSDLPILSAWPGETEVNVIRHRLYGTWDGASVCSAADWAREAKKLIEEAHGAGDVPILVGGTGLYIRTLLEGIAPVPEIDPDIRERVRALPVSDAYEALKHEDLARAAVLSPSDRSRISRALEVIRSTGKKLSDWQAERVGGIGDTVTLHPLILLPERAALYARCDKRFEAMLAGGAVPEVERLLARELPPSLPVMRAIGVAEIAGYLRGEYSLEEATRRGAQATRNYAKRQYTWLRHQPPAHWQRYDPSPHWLGKGYRDYDLAGIFDRLFQS